MGNVCACSCADSHVTQSSATVEDGIVDPQKLEQQLPTLSHSQVPLLLHFDVNKTVLLSDSLIKKSIEDGVRESIAELFWGTAVKDAEGRMVWEWTRTQPSVRQPPDPPGLQNYQQFCKAVSKGDKAAYKKTTCNFSLAQEPKTREEMESWVSLAMQKMELPREIVNTPEAEECGLKGSTFVMLPAFFHLVAALQDQGRPFAIVFRSFGDDHEKIKLEWNAFCELRHPVFSKLIKVRGPLDGSSPDQPDRRIHDIHTLYRDEQGPMLLLNTFTNGPAKEPWDAWAKSKPKPKEDTRDGRGFAKELGSRTIDGVMPVQQWFHQLLKDGATTAIKDDWAWWQFHGEQSQAGKLLPLIGGAETQQIFFDDNVERIVDCRYPDGTVVPAEEVLDCLAVKVNPVAALIDKYYFLRKL